jgi:hypothetical protein
MQACQRTYIMQATRLLANTKNTQDAPCSDVPLRCVAIAEPVGAAKSCSDFPLCCAGRVAGFHRPNICHSPINCQKLGWQRIYFKNDLLTQASKRCGRHLAILLNRSRGGLDHLNLTRKMGLGVSKARCG